MDKRARQALTKELGLEAGYRFIKFSTNSEYLHYGRFEADIPADYLHVKAAQDRYLERLIELIPAGVRRILDVGAGSGKTAEVLIGRGYAVDCVSPGKMMGDLVEERLAGRSTVFRSDFEDAVIPGRYDLILFSESFQYVRMRQALEKSIGLLNPCGYILICDYFKRSLDRPSSFSGGHKYDKWCALYPNYPLEVAVEQDITAETAPLHDIVHKANTDVIAPLIESGRAVAAAHWPITMRIVNFLFRKKIERMLGQQMNGDRTGAEFMRAKVYKIYLFKLAAVAQTAAA